MSTGPEALSGNNEMPGVHSTEYNVALLVKSVNEVLPSELSDSIKEAAKRILETKFQGKISGPSNCAFFYNEVGQELVKVSHQAAAELFARAFDAEKPYEINITTYARNFAIRYDHFVRTVKDPTHEHRAWIIDRKSTLEEAKECIVHFRNLGIYKEGHRQAPRKSYSNTELAGNWDTQALAKVNGYSETLKLIKELQEGILKLAK